MRRSTRENKVICDGTFEEPDNNKDTHIQASDVDEKPIDESNAVVLLFTDTNGKYAMKGVELGQEIQTEILSSSPLDINCLFAPAYYWGFTMLKHVKTGYYVGCDYTGKTTLVRNLKPNYPNPEILFIVNALNLI
nr:uncharacterized protein LOC131790183 [Pocillopora verrucosa]